MREEATGEDGRERRSERETGAASRGRAKEAGANELAI